ncbi:MAG: MBL fold metallo-hydrolase [Bryobacterales bacterium]|nr:MBL fold metallo-hydrolase [Bryobacterales bacterium]MDE0292783.1 MBL fold metallo-hydrolase [Bryobacterales bacterium]
MEVTRTQYPIGQGCFHTGHIRWTNNSSSTSDDFHYIYDCGSSDSTAALIDAIAAFRIQTTRIDALFVSHLDADHVNGIDRLLGSVSVGTVYIPYAGSVVPILEILEADAAGALSASLIEAHMDPESWFGRRGVGRIVKVRSSPDAGPLDPEAIRRDDDDPDERPASGSKLPPKAPFDAKIGTKLTGRRGARPQVKKMDSGDMIIANAGHRLLWALVPHVDPAPKERRRAFYQEIRSVLGLASRQHPSADRLAGALRNKGERKHLRNCYEQIVSGGSIRQHNRVSMSLYSGPRDFIKNSLWIGYAAMAHSYVRAGWCLPTVPHDYWHCRQPSVGWIGAGDATLGVQKVRAAWQRSFQPFREQISTLLLPHHGSGRSFHSDVLDWPNLSLCVAAAGDPSQYRHPAFTVVQEVKNRGHVMHQVSQHPQSELREVFKLQR